LIDKEELVEVAKTKGLNVKIRKKKGHRYLVEARMANNDMGSEK